MNALIDSTNNASSNLSKELKKENVMTREITLLKQKLEDSIENNITFVVYVIAHSFETRKIIMLDDFSIDENYLYLNDGSYEVHINMNEVELKYDDSLDIIFTFIKENFEIGLVFNE